MAKTNPANERIKREYFRYLKDARGRDDATIDGVAKALARFEESTRGKDFKRFHREQAMAFKAGLAAANSVRTGERLSKATMLSILRELKVFFFWLAHLPGFKSHIQYADADYFSMAEKDVAVARARREKRVPTPDQVGHVLVNMPAGTVVERRDRALIDVAATTAARVSALASFRLGHVDLAGGFVEQDARTVRTKFSKTFRTYFMPVVDGALELVGSWVEERRRDHLCGPADPLFPATAMGLGDRGTFISVGVAPHGWATTSPIRDVFRRAFEDAGLPYYNPHSFRDMLVRHAMALNLSPEQMTAWAQNLGHSHVLTTFTSYGNVPVQRQGAIIQAVSAHLGDPGMRLTVLKTSELIAELAKRHSD